MKNLFRRFFSIILTPFESGKDEYHYKTSHRKVLIAMGVLFTGLGSLVLFLAQGEDPGYLLPVFVFIGVGSLCLIIGFLGNERAVAKIWGSGKQSG